MRISGEAGRGRLEHPLGGLVPQGSPVVYGFEGGAVPEGLPGQRALVLPGAGRRVGARVVDGVVLAVGCVVLLLLLGELSDLVDPSGEGALSVALILLGLPLACIAWAVRYHVEATHRWGRTLGKWVFGLKVVPVWTDGTTPVDKRAAATREAALAFASVVPGINLVIGAVLIVAMFRDRPYWRSKWDQGAGTVVVRWPLRG